MQLLKITDKIFLVPAHSKGRFPFAHSVYVDGERKILFDAGIGNRVLNAFLQEYPVDIVIFSHSHADHCSGAGLLKGKAPLFVPAHSKDEFGSIGALGAKRFQQEEPLRYWEKLFVQGVEFQEAEADQTYDGRSAFDLGDVRLAAIHAPGHSKDHHAFIEQQSGLLLLFDVDLSPAGPWYADPESDIEQYEATIGLLRAYNAEMAVSSHMGVLRRNVDEKLKAFGRFFDERDDKIWKKLSNGPRTAESIATEFPFTPKHLPQLRPLYLYWETNMVKKHLDRLIERGSANPSSVGYHKA